MVVEVKDSPPLRCLRVGRRRLKNHVAKAATLDYPVVTSGFASHGEMTEWSKVCDSSAKLASNQEVSILISVSWQGFESPSRHFCASMIFMPPLLSKLCFVLPPAGGGWMHFRCVSFYKSGSRDATRSRNAMFQTVYHLCIRCV